MTNQTKAKIAIFRVAERFIDRMGVLMLLALGLAAAGATVAVGF